MFKFWNKRKMEPEQDPLKEALERLSHKRVEKVPNRTEGVKPALLNLHEHFGNSLESYTFSVLEDFCAGVDLIKQKQDT